MNRPKERLTKQGLMCEQRSVGLLESFYPPTAVILQALPDKPDPAIPTQFIKALTNVV